MVDSIKAFRTITRCFIGRQVQILGNTVILPIALAANPSEISINPGDKIEKVMEKACDGRDVIAFTYPKGSEPEIEMKFPMAVMELEALLHGHIVAPVTGTTEVMVLSEFNSAAAPGGRPVGTIGNSVTAQTVTSKALGSYIDPATKVAKKLKVVASAPTAVDEISIGIGLAVTCSAPLIALGVDIKLWVPCLVTGATVITADPIGLITVFAQGVDHDGNARSVSARNCSRTESGSIGSASERQFKLSILPDVLSISKLGFDIVSVPLTNAC